MKALIIVSIVVLAFFIFLYNSLVAKKNQVLNIFGTLDAMLKKRFDLFPNLVATVKGYMQYERSLLENVTKMRASAMTSRLSDDQKVDLDNDITKVLAGIMVAVENYPNLKADQNFMHLQRTLNEIEEQISAARRAYNASVTDYNNALEMFPSNIVASMMSYKRKNLFEIAQDQRQPIDAGDLLKS